MLGGLTAIAVGIFFIIIGLMDINYSTGIVNLFLGLSLVLIGVLSIAYKINTKIENDNFNQDENIDNKTNELLEYKKLLDAGVVTQEEFEKKKKEILG